MERERFGRSLPRFGWCVGTPFKKASKDGELGIKGESLGLRERNGQQLPTVERRDACPPEMEVNECQTTPEFQLEALVRELSDPLFASETLCDCLRNLDDECLKALLKLAKAELTRRHRPKQEGDPALLQTNLAAV